MIVSVRIWNSRIGQLKARHGVNDEIDLKQVLIKEKNSLSYDNTHSKSHSNYISCVPKRMKSKHKQTPNYLSHKPSLDMYYREKSPQTIHKGTSILLPKNLDISDDN